MNWPHQDLVKAEVPKLIEAGKRRILVTSPTGGGKSRMMCDLIEWAKERHWYAVLYTNRKLLIEQLTGVLSKAGITHGVRAAGHEDNRHLQIQISSLATERSRVLEKEDWKLHGWGSKVLAIVDEAHLNCADTAVEILGRHHKEGASYVGFTATPIDLGHLYEHLVVAGNPSGLRACGALVPAYHYGPDEPDTRKLKQQINGDFSEQAIRKVMMTKTIWGRVLDWFHKLNPTNRPTILFAPGVKESIWFAEQFSKAGHPAASIDGQGIWDGEYHHASSEDREGLLKRVRSGRVQVLCNRFVAREGLDLPEVSHIVLATVFGSLGSYLQSVGRGMRRAEGKEALTIQDHGGMWWRHGSVNLDREWQLEYTESICRGLREWGLRNHTEPEPICCPVCAKIRARGPKCPQCGHEATKHSRRVVQMDGSLKEYFGDIFKARRLCTRRDGVEIWKRMYYRSKNSDRTFVAAEALFAAENNWAWPSRDWPYMPFERLDFFRPVKNVPWERLIHPVRKEGERVG